MFRAKSSGIVFGECRFLPFASPAQDHPYMAASAVAAIARAAELRRRRAVVETIRSTRVVSTEEAIRNHPQSGAGAERLQGLAAAIRGPRMGDGADRKTGAPNLGWNATEPWLQLPIQIGGGPRWAVAYYLLNGFQVLHVFAGILALVFLLFRKLDTGRSSPLRWITCYWYGLCGTGAIVASAVF